MGAVNLTDIAKTIMEDVALYNKKSFLFPLFLISLLFLRAVEKDMRLRTVLVYLVAAFTVVFFCPFYAWAGMMFDGDVYYRVLWMLPVGMLVCYCAVWLMAHFRRPASKAVVFVTAVIVICANGDLVYTTSFHVKSVNAYHIPRQVIAVADALRLDNYTPIAVLPAELLPFLRQYTADILTPYGRNMLERSWTFQNDLYDAMEGDASSYDIARVAKYARAEHCAFVVLSCAKQMDGSMEEQGYFMFRFVEGYFIYMDYNYYNVYKEQGLLDADVIEVGEQYEKKL